MIDNTWQTLVNTGEVEDKGERALGSQKEYAFLIRLYIVLGKATTCCGESGVPLNTSEEADWSSCCWKGQTGLWAFYPMKSQD